MKTLADFKRRLIVGAKLNCVFHGKPLVIRENLNNIIFFVPEPSERTVKKVQTNSVCFTRPDGKEAWLTYPKSDEIEFPDANTAEIFVWRNAIREKILTYTFV